MSKELNSLVDRIVDFILLTLDDPFSYLSFLETSTKRDGRDYRRRVMESEKANEDMKQWYLDRNYERGEARIRANRSIYSRR